MIEIVYDEEREKNSDTGRKKYELPKNIRQVGNAPGNYKIYIGKYDVQRGDTAWKDIPSRWRKSYVYKWCGGCAESRI